MPHGTRQFVVILLFLLLASDRGVLAQQAAEVSGTVRNLQGKPQMGVLVELLNASPSSTARAALTDLEGRYQIKDVLPGIYQIRATATLYLPSLRQPLRLSPRTNRTVDLTMSGLFDETGWMSASRHDDAEERNDWKWTLRSPANRPLLRLVEDGDGGDTTLIPEAGRRGSELHGALTFENSGGGFGSSGTGESLVIGRGSSDRRTSVTLRTKSARTADRTSTTPMSVSALLESEGSTGNKHRTTVKLSTFPQVHNAAGASFSAFEIGSAERVHLAELASLEVGSETQYLTLGASALVTHPFLRLTSRPLGGWSVGYAVTTSPYLSHYDDLGSGDFYAPSVQSSGRRLLTEAGVHQEAGVGRTLGKTRLQLMFSQDDVQRSAVSGRLRSAYGGKVSLDNAHLSAAGILIDGGNDTFRLLTPGWSESGFGVSFDLPLSESVTLAGGYVLGPGSRLSPVLGQSRSGSAIKASASSALLASVKGHLPRTGTRISVTYRWQPESTVSTIAPSAMAGVEPYLSLHVRQDLSSTVELFVDGDNLAAQGYQACAVAQQQAILASALRDLRAGLSINF